VRWIARTIGARLEAVVGGICELVSRGYVERVPVRNGQRAEYRLTSAIFAPKQGDAEPVVVQVPLGKCSGCGFQRKIQRSGYCAKCAARIRTEDHVARIVAENPEVTDEQVYVQVRTKAARTVRRALLKARRGVA